MVECISTIPHPQQAVPELHLSYSVLSPDSLSVLCPQYNYVQYTVYKCAFQIQYK